MRSLRLFLEKLTPAILFMVTNAPNLPPKALEKHLRIVEAATERAYLLVTEGSDDWNRRFWVME